MGSVSSVGSMCSERSAAARERGTRGPHRYRPPAGRHRHEAGRANPRAPGRTASASKRLARAGVGPILIIEDALKRLATSIAGMRTVVDGLAAATDSGPPLRQEEAPQFGGDPVRNLLHK